MFVLLYSFIIISIIISTIFPSIFFIGIHAFEEPHLIRLKAIELFDSGRHRDLLIYLNHVESHFGNLVIDNIVPSLYSYRGVALSGHSGGDNEEAVNAFLNATKYYPQDSKSWMNLGEVYMYVFKFREAERALLKANALGADDVLSRLISVKGWVASWKDFERLSGKLERLANRCVERFPVLEGCTIDTVLSMEYTDVSAITRSIFFSMSPNSREPPRLITTHERAPLWRLNTFTDRQQRKDLYRRRLKVGVVSSDFGIHPVASLFRGFVAFMNQSRVELYCFSVSAKISWWSANISQIIGADHFVNLDGMNSKDAARAIASLKIEVLIDLNGHTLQSGLPLMAFRPSPLQLTFLGWPTTTAAPFIDYYIGDWITNPAEKSRSYFERLALIPPAYIINDLAQTQGHILYLTGENRAPRSYFAKEGQNSIEDATVLFSSFSNTVKWDPSIFAVWMNILQRCPGSMIAFVDYKEMPITISNVQTYSPWFGVNNDRLQVGQMHPWMDHLYAKTAIDFNLDTIAKNAHTTGLDAAWAGVPMLSLGGGDHGPTRAGESHARALENPFGVVFSLKEYEDFTAFVTDDCWSTRLKQNAEKYKAGRSMGRTNNMFSSKLSQRSRQGLSPWRLRILRDFVEKQRYGSGLFDARTWSDEFVDMLQATWELEHIAEKLHPAKDEEFRRDKKVYHYYASVPCKPTKETDQRRITVYHAVDPNVGPRPWFPTSRQKQSFVQKHGFDVSSPLLTQLRSTRFHCVDHKPHAGEALSVLPVHSSSQTKAKSLNLDIEVARPEIRYHYQKRCNYKMEMTPTDVMPLLKKKTMLNIGGIPSMIPEPDPTQVDPIEWLVVSSTIDPSTLLGRSGRNADVVRYMHDLQGFPDQSVIGIYASHVVEHNSFGDGMLEAVFIELRRVLKPGGLLMLSVPDLGILARMYHNASLEFADRIMIMKMMYGAQVDEFDHHVVAFDFETMRTALVAYDFCEIERVGLFNIFGDSSSVQLKGRHISLNVVARPCPHPDDPVPDFRIEINADKYDPDTW